MAWYSSSPIKAPPTSSQVDQLDEVEYDEDDEDRDAEGEEATDSSSKGGLDDNAVDNLLAAAEESTHSLPIPDPQTPSKSNDSFWEEGPSHEQVLQAIQDGTLSDGDNVFEGFPSTPAPVLSQSPPEPLGRSQSGSPPAPIQNPLFGAIYDSSPLKRVEMHMPSSSPLSSPPHPQQHASLPEAGDDIFSPAHRSPTPSASPPPPPSASSSSPSRPPVAGASPPHAQNASTPAKQANASPSQSKRHPASKSPTATRVTPPAASPPKSGRSPFALRPLTERGSDGMVYTPAPEAAYPQEGLEDSSVPSSVDEIREWLIECKASSAAKPLQGEERQAALAKRNTLREVIQERLDAFEEAKEEELARYKKRMLSLNTKQRVKALAAGKKPPKVPQIKSLPTKQKYDGWDDETFGEPGNRIKIKLSSGEHHRIRHELEADILESATATSGLVTPWMEEMRSQRESCHALPVPYMPDQLLFTEYTDEGYRELRRELARMYASLPNDIRGELGNGYYKSSKIDREARIYLAYWFMEAYIQAGLSSDGAEQKQFRAKLKHEALWSKGEGGRPKGLFYFFNDYHPQNPLRVCDLEESAAISFVSTIPPFVLVLFG